MADEFLRLENLVKNFGGHQVVKGVEFGIGRGEFVSFLGPSGCGKTTVLRMIAGFERPSEGRIVVDGRDITDLRPNQRKIGMVFQAYALFPNMNVEGNIGFGLKIAGMGREEIRARVEEMLKLIGLTGFGKRFPFELSGGQQQRVALARALAPRPRLLLLDEPLSALDAKIRVALRDQIRAIQRELAISTVFVTHDQEEALSISDRIVVMNQGGVEQVGTPLDIYNRPATPFVAGFVGTLNTLHATVESADQRLVRVGASSFVVPSLPDSASTGTNLVVKLRPESLRLDASGSISSIAEVVQVSFLGAVLRIGVKIGEDIVHADRFNDRNAVLPAVGEKVQVSFNPEDVLSAA
jgi:putative spermidine/putrescine transport system ATP-binding protein